MCKKAEMVEDVSSYQGGENRRAKGDINTVFNDELQEGCVLCFADIITNNYRCETSSVSSTEEPM